MIPAVMIMGPTASGKSRLAMAIARQVPAEIVSVDSAQVYRGMDIGTAKPDAAERAAVPHHLLDILDPAHSYSAARFRADALRLIADIRARARVPLLVGGTMLYFRALQAGLADLPPADPALRARIAQRAQEQGWPALHAELARVDAATAARLAPTDRQRVQRALEIFELTGVAASVLHAQGAQAAATDAVGATLKLALEDPSRAALHARIEARFHEMLRAGFLDEVAGLRARGDLAPELPSMRAVGYRQLWRHLDGAWSLAEAARRGIAASRQLAKRQLTWLRSESGVERFDPAASDLDRRVLQSLQARVPKSLC